MNKPNTTSGPQNAKSIYDKLMESPETPPRLLLTRCQSSPSKVFQASTSEVCLEMHQPAQVQKTRDSE